MPRLSPLLAALRWIAAPALLVALAASCGDKVQSDLTGMDIHVSFDESVPVYKLRFSGWVGADVAVAQEDRPDDRTPAAAGENLVILLPDSADGSSVFVQVDGIDRGGLAIASTGVAISIERGSIARVDLVLGEPRLCGDGEVHPTAELCDDGNRRPGDGCSSQCVSEVGWDCAGEPSVCRQCGDGVCSQGEDQCSCPEDCAGATCGDGLCCEAAGEACGCAEDCGEPACGDGTCCESEDDCPADCGDCGNGRCELDKGEDECRCPEDCKAGQGECGNGSCCEAGGEDASNCPLDCCQSPVCGDDACCPDENADECSEDCCAQPTCNDGVCCPGETAAECAADCCESSPVCGDGLCCPGSEDAESCAEDCCGDDPPCGDGQCCPGEVCEADGCEAACEQPCSGGACDPCCEVCTGGDCAFTCDRGCDCSYDCTSNAGECNIACPGSACFVECAGSAKCVVDCRDPGQIDGGPVDPGRCACRGGACVLTCPAGDAFVCPDGESIACTPAACPTPVAP